MKIHPDSGETTDLKLVAGEVPGSAGGQVPVSSFDLQGVIQQTQ
jgi:hypothetical protein